MFYGFVLVVLAYKYSHYFIASMTAHATAFYVPLGLVTVSLNAAMTHYGTGPAPIGAAPRPCRPAARRPRRRPSRGWSPWRPGLGW